MTYRLLKSHWDGLSKNYILHPKTCHDWIRLVFKCCRKIWITLRNVFECKKLKHSVTMSSLIDLIVVVILVKILYTFEYIAGYWLHSGQTFCLSTTKTSNVFVLFIYIRLTLDLATKVCLDREVLLIPWRILSLCLINVKTLTYMFQT